MPESMDIRLVTWADAEVTHAEPPPSEASEQPETPEED